MEMKTKPDNKSKLMRAAIHLMAEKGYKGVSTKEIAAASGVSEMTLFRNFGSKLSLLEQAVDRYHYSVEMTQVFNRELVWELRKDLLTIGRIYYELMDRNRKLFLIVLQDNDLASIREKAQSHPRKLRELLSDYFAEMQRRNKMIEVDAEAQAMTFMWMNYGAFMSQLFSPSPLSSLTPEQFRESSVDLFVRALSP
ncbi:TetR/AcrR family transcriptional regulator [Paenibacillus soyae]|uniref:TetR/AcrR family transcriptional regulator n=1 Tax=Paenibacillus soyae TaxID=2969249 RepID=A0A9X2SD80_9BACL|nr:TetR/AcrR family transcriptional regulator [Paenibacillus soyae]MCR2807608.1 TetR/AcrR family transcriptional regulator [Paenibacillus soyae]